MENTESNLTPEEEQKVTEQLQKQALEKSINPIEIASSLFGLYQPKFCMLVDKLSSNALRRVLKMLISEPLEPLGLKTQTQNEADCYAIGDRLMEAKYMLILTQHFDKVLEQEQKEQNIENPVSLEPKFDEKEENNGETQA